MALGNDAGKRFTMFWGMVDASATVNSNVFYLGGLYMRPEMNSSRDETHPGMRYRSVYMVPEMSKCNDL